MNAMTCLNHIPHGCSAIGLLAAQDAMFALFQTTLSLLVTLPTQDFDHMMHSAVANGNLRALELMLVEKKRIRLVNSGRHRRIPVFRFANSLGQSSWMWAEGTALHTAVQFGHYECCQVLLEHGFDPDTLDFAGVPSSHLAARQGCDEILELLLSHDCAVDARDAAMLTTLGAAVTTGNMTVIKLLLSRGADVSARDCLGQSLFQIASSSRKPAVFFSLLDAGLEPSIEDIRSWYYAGDKQTTWWARDHLERLAVTPEFLITFTDTISAKSVLNLVPPYYRKLNLTCRITKARYTALYRASILDDARAVIRLNSAGAMLNLEGGAEGTPLMGACKAGRLGVVKYLVRNGAVLGYMKNGFRVNAFEKAASYPKIRRWLLAERFTEQRMILDGQTSGEQAADVEDEGTWTDEIADVTLDLVLEDDVEQYLESKNWFLPMRRFVDDGQGAFVRVPILPGEFARYRPLGFKVSPG
jgi:ankyrin repeat protein